MIAVSNGLAEPFLLCPAVLVPFFKSHDTLARAPKLPAAVNY